MKHTAIITSNTKLPKGWTYKDGKATKGNLTIYSKEAYTLAQKRKNRIPFYRIAIPITRHNVLGELKHVHDYHDLTIKEAETFFPALSNDPKFNTIIQGAYQFDDLYEKQQKRIQTFCKLLEEKYPVTATLASTEDLEITLERADNEKPLGTYYYTTDQYPDKVTVFSLYNYITDKDLYADIENWLNKKSITTH